MIIYTVMISLAEGRIKDTSLVDRPVRAWGFDSPSPFGGSSLSASPRRGDAKNGENHPQGPPVRLVQPKRSNGELRRWHRVHDDAEDGALHAGRDGPRGRAEVLRAERGRGPGAASAHRHGREGRSGIHPEVGGPLPSRFASSHDPGGAARRSLPPRKQAVRPPVRSAHRAASGRADGGNRLLEAPLR